MLEIKSLADQLRESLRATETLEKQMDKQEDEEIPVKANLKKKAQRGTDEHKINTFFKAIDEFKLEATEKSMIRVDARTINLLKRMKLAKGIDMNRFIVYALHQYISQHPWLAKHIQETLKNSDL